MIIIPQKNDKAPYAFIVDATDTPGILRVIVVGEDASDPPKALPYDEYVLLTKDGWAKHQVSWFDGTLTSYGPAGSFADLANHEALEQALDTLARVYKW